MTNVVILPKSAEPEASTSVSANRGLQANQNNNQEFSKTFAASLEQHTKRAAVQRNQRQAPAANAPDHATMDNVDKHDRVQVADAGDTQRKPADATGRSLPESGKRLQDKKSPSHAEDSAAVPVQSDAQPVQAPDAVQTAATAINEQTAATVIDSAARQAVAVTAAAPQDTLATDTDAAPLSPPPTSPKLPEQTTLQQGAADGIEPDSLSTAAESAASPAGLINSAPVQPAADDVATPDSPLQTTNGRDTGPSATAVRARNPQLTDPGLARQNPSALSAAEDEATATAAESVKRVVQGTPAQQSAQAHNMPAQPFSEQIKQWFDARQSLTSASDGVAADIREGKSGALQTNNPVKLSAVNLEAMNPDALRRFNNHLLFERLMSQPGAGGVRSTAADTGAIQAAAATVLAEPGAQDPKLAEADPLAHLTVSGIDGRTIAPANTTSNMMPVLPVQTPMQHPAWSQDVGHKLMFMVNQDLQQAQLQMNPRHLGPLEVRISMGHEQQVNVSFIAQNAVARDAIDGAMPRLRDMLEQQGLNLNDFNVSQENFKGQHEQAAQQGEQATPSYSGFGNDEQQDLDAVPGITQTTHLASDRLVDYFA